MKTSQLLLGLAFVGASAAACSVKTTSTTGSAGAGGDAGATVTSTNGTTVSTVSSVTNGPASSSTGGSGCDDGTKGDFQSDVCTSCVQCAAASTCASEVAACGAGTDCGTFDDCRIACITSADANKNKMVDDGAELTEFYKCFGLDQTTGKPDAALTMSCVAKHGAGYTGYQAQNDCIYGDCPVNCGTGGTSTPICDSGLASSNKVCADCLTKNCCAELKTCVANADCKACILDDPQPTAKCDKTMLDEAANGCYVNKCMVECK